MYIYDNWLRPIEEIMFTIKGSGSKVVGLTSIYRESGVSSLTRSIAIEFKHSQTESLIIDLSKPLVLTNDQSLWSRSWLDIGRNQPTDRKMLDVLTATPSINDRMQFNNADFIREVFENCLETYDLITVDLPELVSGDKMLINPLAAAAACDTVIIVCAANNLDRSDLQKAHQNLSVVKANVLGVVINEYNGKN